MALIPKPNLPPAPTLVSTFEVLFEQQFPAIKSTVIYAGANEYVIKGYFLTIANPNQKAYSFDVGFHCNPPGTGDRGLTATAPFLDTSLPGAQPSFGGATQNGKLRIQVPAQGTVLLGLLPLIFSPVFGFKPPTDIDVRGWVDLTLPALRPPKGFIYTSQSSSPVPVIVTAEQRLTFLTPTAGNTLTGTPPVMIPPGTTPIDFSAVESQAAFALPLATGMASFSVPPQPGTLLTVPPIAEQDAEAAEFIDSMMRQSPTIMTRLFGKPVHEKEPTEAN